VGYTDLVEKLSALGHEYRLKILTSLTDGEKSEHSPRYT